LNPNKNISDYMPSPDLYWVVEKDGILLIERKSRTFSKLDQTESSLWSMYVMGFPGLKITEFLMAVKKATKPEAEKILEEMVKKWCEQGYIQKQK